MVLLLSSESSFPYLPVMIGAACGLLVLAYYWYRKFTTAPTHEEFEDLQFSLGAEPAEPDVIALKNAEIAALTERLLDLESLGNRIAHIEKRHLAERDRLEKELLEATLEAEEKKSFERRWKAIRTRYRNLKERLDEFPDDMDEAEGKLDGVRKELERSEALAERQRKEIERLKQRLTRRDALVEKNKERLERALADTEKQREKAAQLRHEHVETKRELRDLKRELEAPRAVDLMSEPEDGQPEAEPQPAPKPKKAAAKKKSTARRKKSGA